ncbi:pyridoxal phosphate-dependent decarboxylase family protein [Bacillus altitudinis]|uniref:pyridoxal phosphate-dependent decarboxylase family protein n=1 Tax=Bacillus altitudinis TaxID=293387 RepID=UPI000705C5CE|nr:pyridoxal-dependent decarboxylase [Bacillus altitudinis]ALM26589.1 2,4-diaminobutyrate decarboxylase [Bacillus altitudinis]ALM46677.1 2,4-diaminobutyrate decarboxylase [Bacillus altitudinis]ANY98159.1 2,4-diaminobutyrate decarboxylase [Bacillus altitudinis]
MTVRVQNLVQNWFPSEDGNAEERKELIKLMEQIISGVDDLKDPNRAHLKGEKNREEDFYKKLTETSQIPMNGQQAELVNEELLKLLHNHPYHTKYFFTNILPMASTPGILGMLTAMLVNGNNLWDVYGPAGAEAEVRVVSMMSKLIGYDPNVSGGYTTWGGQGAIFSGLRLAIAKVAPESLRKGVPQNLYAFCSDAAHYSLFKSMEATGIGTDNLIRIKTNKDHSMDMEDLRCQMERVAQNGGIPVYIVATTGTTDAIAIDDVKGVRETAEAIAEKYGLKVPHIHADSALGGFFAFFNEYDVSENPLQFSDGVLRMLKEIKAKFQNLSLADTMCFDFQKLGQTPYTSSLFLVKNAADLKRLDLEEQETPYVGHRGYGEYHTGYTLECSRMGSSISMLSVLLTFGIEGYQRLLGQFLEVNLAFREALRQEIPQAEVVNDDNVGMATLFRIYLDGSPRFKEEISGEATAMEIERNNDLNKILFEKLGEKRDEMFFGDTTKFLQVNAKEGQEFYLSVSKFFVISPYTLPEHIPHIVSYLKDVIASVCGQFESVEA